jgi:hypothetical protein
VHLAYLHESSDQTLWLQIVRAKYPGANDIFGSNHQGGGSPFWHSIHKIKDYFKPGGKFQLEMGLEFGFGQTGGQGEPS